MLLLMVVLLTGCTQPSLKDAGVDAKSKAPLGVDQKVTSEELEALALQGYEARMETAQAMIDYAEKMQAEIDRLQAQGEDTSALEARRERLLNTANQAFGW